MVYDEILAKGSDLWAISPQGQEANVRLRDRYALPYPILADEDQQVIVRWGIYNHLDPKNRPIPYPATYVIDRQGVIRWHKLGLAARDRPNPGQIISVLTRLQSTKPTNEGKQDL